MARLRRPPLLIRITHALVVPALAILVATGLELWSAYPFFGPRGATYDAIPLQGIAWPAALRLGDGIAGARALHLALAWLFVVDALVYLGSLVAARQGRARLALYSRGKRALYLGAFALAALLVVSGFVLWKPVQLAWLGTPLGGYDGARVVHYFAMLGLLALVLAHVVWVVVELRRKSPEAA